MALPDSFATVHYTEFGHVIDRAPRAFAHARPNKTLTAGRVPGANVGVDFTRCPSYGSRQYGPLDILGLGLAFKWTLLSVSGTR